MPPPFIPGEITDTIISFIWHDKPTLCTCCLVCQSWLPASRHHLLSTINLVEADYDKLIGQTLRYPHMYASLASLSEVQIRRHGRRSDYTPELASQKWTRFLHDFSGHLPNLAQIILHVVDFRARTPFRSHLLLSNFSGVRTLELSYCQFPSFHSMRRTIEALVSLTELSLHYPRWGRSEEIDPPPPAHIPDFISSSRPRPRLLILSMGLENCHAYSYPIVEWLLHTPSRFLLRCVDLLPMVCTPPFFHAYTTFLESLPNSLSCLSLPAFDAFGQLPPLSHFVALKDLRIDLQDLETAGHQSEWEVVSRMLPTLRCSLLHLTFRIEKILDKPDAAPSRDGNGNTFMICLDDLELLQPVLAKEAFNTLEDVLFLVRPQYNEKPKERRMFLGEDVIFGIRAKIPQMYARGCMHVECIDPYP